MEENEYYEGKEPDIKDYWYVIAKRKEIVIVFFALVFIFTLIFSLLQTPLYKSTSIIEIKPDKIQIVEDLSGQAYYTTSLETLMNTQVRILQSRTLAKTVVSKLGLLPKRKEIMKVKSTDNRVPEEKINESEAADSLVDYLLKSLEVKLIRNTRLIEVSFILPDPKMANLLTNSWVENFVYLSAKQETLTNRNTNLFIIEQIDKLQKEIAEKEAKLRSLSQDSEIVIMDEKLNIAMKNLSQLNTSLFDAQTERINKESYYNKVKNSAPDALPEVFNNPIIQNLQNDYNKLEKEYNEKSKIFKPLWPEMLRLKDQLQKAEDKLKEEKNKIYQNILESARGEYLAAMQKEEKIKNEFQQQKNEAMKINNDAISYNSLKVELENQKNLLDSLLKKKEETSISANMQEQAQQNIRVIEEASIPKTPIKPKIKLNLILAIIIGLFGGAALAFFIDYLDDKVRSIEDIEHYIKLPLLGLIPRYHGGSMQIKSKKKWSDNILEQVGIKKISRVPAIMDGIPYLLTHSSPKSLIAEAFRVIRTAVLLSKAAMESRCILITSSQPKEGKTFVAANLAIAFSQIQRKVILVDCDLRNPMVHKVFKLENKHGLNSFLLNTKNINEIIFSTSINNLDIILTGHRAPRPAELLSLPNFKKLLDSLKEKYDYVIIDSPPVLPIADTAIIAPYVDMILLILLNEGTPRKSAMLAIDRLQSLNCPLFGCILNSVDFEGRSNYYYKYYNYSYYYGSEGKS